uniref:G-protein coupled receptors family 1 profile domain-containing protein n=1 Tax=Xenopus tropicalis TaxID=8364 RepID=A0A1B8Y437_XENTR|eukprot:XP_002942451.1 PREDICTED: olfactory receptor 13C8-like [Xenopus tropicalis]
MANGTVVFSNVSQLSSSNNKVAVIVQTFFFALLLLFFIMFLYLIAGILNIYFSTPHLRETLRCVFFAHMLVSDTLYFLVALFLLLSSIYLFQMPIPFCLALQTLATVTYRVTPYNLAVMSIEQYVAICFPLRHGEFSTDRNSNVAIAIMWVVGLIPNGAEFLAMSPVVTKDFFLRSALCNRATIVLNPVQDTIRTFSYIITFILVALVIVFTYIKVTLVARKVTSKQMAASKAGKTVMLHALQLFLCTSAILASLTEQYLKDYIPFLFLINFLLFMCLPRFLSPLIYGLRDEAFRKGIRQLFSIRCSR